jgi:GAF domain-containing protein/biotin carboxyl carrier protein
MRALAELGLAEGLPAVAACVALWASAFSRSDGALVWVPHGSLPLFVCAGAAGEGTERCPRRTVPHEGGVVGNVVRGRETLVLGPAEIRDSSDPWLQAVPAGVSACLAVPLESGGQIVGILALLYMAPVDADASREGLGRFLGWGIPALDRALRADRKTTGMLQAIERLTNLFDLTKSFASTIDLAELAQLIARKAADFGGAEAASLWLLEGDEAEVVLAATAVNENYDVDPVPVSVGSGVAGGVIAEREAVRFNGLAADDPAAGCDPAYPVRSLLAVPLVEHDAPLGALVLANKRGRHPEFSAADEELLLDLSRQAVRALRNARLYEAEKKVEELDALLAVSREITSTLDLDKVLATIVNASSALIDFDRATIAVLQRGQLRLGAVSGMAEIDWNDRSVRRTVDLLEWVFHSGLDVAVTQHQDGALVTDRPETEEKFRVFFAESGRRSFNAALLCDEEGKLGVLAFESHKPLVFHQGTRDLVQILINQATVAVRNAQLYQQVPLAGFWKPLLEKRKELGAMPVSRRVQAAVGAAAALALLLLVPWRQRVEGPARVVPARESIVAAQVDGVVETVLKQEGDLVAAGEPLARLRDRSHRAAIGGAREELKAPSALAADELERTWLRAPIAGVVVTPRLDQRVGQLLTAGAAFCVVADTTAVVVEVAVPEEDASLVRMGSPLALKVNSFPGITFRGAVTWIGAVVHQEGDERFVIARTRVENPGRTLMPGMLGKAKVEAGDGNLLSALLRRPVRYLWLRIWPALP